jgi:hypothetical protein
MGGNKTIEEQLTVFCDDVTKLAPSPFNKRLDEFLYFARHLRTHYAGSGESYPPGTKETIARLSSQAKTEFGSRMLK